MEFSEQLVAYYHPKKLDKSRHHVSYTGVRSEQIRAFMAEYDLRTTKEWIKYVVNYYFEFKPKVRYFVFVKSENVMNKTNLMQWRCKLEDEADCELFARINYLYENGDAVTRSDALYCVFCAVRDSLKKLRKVSPVVEFDSRVQRTKRKYVRGDIGKLRVGASMVYAKNMALAEGMLDDWMRVNYETGNRYKLFEESGVIKIYREL